MKQLGIPGIAGAMPGELIVDLFAGGGGASAGIEQALGRSPDIAINHDPAAVKMHEANHPATRHYCESVYDVDPVKATSGQAVGLLWLSPDCRHFSRAKGGAPVSKSVRALAWIGLRWAKRVRPRVVCLENVPEFRTWGPLLPDGRPNDQRGGDTFRAFLEEWRRYGYTVDHRVLVAADFGAPTTRKRLFLVARCDGEEVRWPEPTHGKSGKPRPWRTAAECIDWTIPVPSIFERKRPLAQATCRRIARGVMRYVLTAAKPFIVSVAHGDHVARPGDRCTDPDSPLGVVTQTNTHALVAPTLVQTSYGEREGQAPRCLDLQAPLGAVVAGGQKHALVASTLVRMNHGDKQWHDVAGPLGTVCAGANHHALVAAFLAKHNGGHEATGQPLTDPTHTITGTDQKAVVAAHLMRFNQNGVGQDLRDPLATVMAGAARHALVAAFLVAYYSNGKQDQPLDEPIATIVSRARHGLVTVVIDGVTYALIDLGMRMLEPHELARAQGFADDYILTGTKSQRIARIGNSVCPPVAAAVVRANLVGRSHEATA